MSAVTKHLHVKLTAADESLLSRLRAEHDVDTDSQLVRLLLRREGKRLGIGGPDSDTMPPPGPRPGRKKRRSV